MNIILTHSYFLSEDVRESKLMIPYPPLGMLYISAFLEQNGINHEVIDSTFSNYENWEKQILEIKPDIIGFYVTFQTRSNILKMIQKIRSFTELSKTCIILGGPDVRYNIESYLLHEADYLIYGEGEESMLELVKYLQHSLNDSIENIEGIAYKLNGKTQINKERTLIENLDKIPLPARHQVDIQKYLDTWKKHHGYSSVTINTMRGCPFSCNWCSKSVFGNITRRRSPDSVVEEIVWLQKHYLFDKIWFVDDVFTISKSWLQTFSELLEQSEIKISFEIITRVDCLNEETIELLKKTGCYRIWIGAESGSQRILDAMNRKTDINKAISTIKLIKIHGIQAGTFIIIGYPDEKREDIHKTIFYLKTALPDLFTITKAYPIIGTLFYDNVKELIKSKDDWACTSDRDINFKRTYPDRYYRAAISLICNEVGAIKARGMVSKIKCKIKVIMAKTYMGLMDIFH